MSESNNNERPTSVCLPRILELRSGPEAGRRIEIPDGVSRIGRGGASEIRVQDPDVPPGISREHATLTVTDGRVLVMDHSANGTRVGCRWLTRGECVALERGMKLQLGPSLVLASAGDAPNRGRVLGARQAAPSKAGDLWTQFTSRELLHTAWKRVELNRGAAGPDGVTIEQFRADALRRLGRLRDLLLHDRYEPLAPRLFAAPKRDGGTRCIAILSVQDRVVQQALLAVLQPQLEPRFPPCSYAYRPGICAHHALRRVEELLARGRTWVAETDIARFFDEIRHDVLLDQLRQAVADPSIISVVARCLDAGVREPGRGVPQGGAASPLFSNLYLAGFDAHMIASGWPLVRYGDDLVIPCRQQGEALTALAAAEGYLRSHLALALKPEKTNVTALCRGFTFLGFRFDDAGRRPAPEAMSHLRERLAEARPGDVDAIVRGWKGYFGKDAVTRAGTSPPVQRNEAPSPVNEPSDREVLGEHLLAVCAGREDVYARQNYSGGKMRFMPCSGSLGSNEVVAHLSGAETLALYLHQRDDRVRLVVLDLDVLRPDADQAPVRSLATELGRICREWGVPALLEESGQKGRHLWIPFAAPVPADTARRLARLLLARTEGRREGVRVEILPRHPSWAGPELGDAVKLPLGLHPATGRRCALLDAEGEPVADPTTLLAQVRPLDPSALPRLLQALGTRTPGMKHVSATGAVEQLRAGCTVLRALEERAARTGHLRHTHNLILLYTAGQLGAEGASYLHRVIGLTRNYKPEICQRYIDRLDPTRKPLTCARIREWLEEETEQDLCKCPRERRTPLESLREQITPPPPCETRSPAPLMRTDQPEADGAWEQIAHDIFARAAPPEPSLQSEAAEDDQ